MLFVDFVCNVAGKDRKYQMALVAVLQSSVILFKLKSIDMQLYFKKQFIRFSVVFQLISTKFLE